MHEFSENTLRQPSGSSGSSGDKTKQFRVIRAIRWPCKTPVKSVVQEKKEETTDEAKEHKNV